MPYNIPKNDVVNLYRFTTIQSDTWMQQKRKKKKRK